MVQQSKLLRVMPAYHMSAGSSSNCSISNSASYLCEKAVEDDQDSRVHALM